MQRITMSVSSLTSGLFLGTLVIDIRFSYSSFPNYAMIHLFRKVQKKFSNLRPTFRHRFIILMSKLFSKELESYVNKINHLRVSEFKYSMLFRRISIFLKSKVFCLQISIFYNPSESNFCKCST